MEEQQLDPRLGRLIPVPWFGPRSGKDRFRITLTRLQKTMMLGKPPRSESTVLFPGGDEMFPDTGDNCWAGDHAQRFDREGFYVTVGEVIIYLRLNGQQEATEVRLYGFDYPDEEPRILCIEPMVIHRLEANKVAVLTGFTSASDVHGCEVKQRARTRMRYPQQRWLRFPRTEESTAKTALELVQGRHAS